MATNCLASGGLTPYYSFAREREKAKNYPGTGTVPAVIPREREYIIFRGGALK